MGWTGRTLLPIYRLLRCVASRTALPLGITRHVPLARLYLERLPSPSLVRQLMITDQRLVGRTRLALTSHRRRGVPRLRLRLRIGCLMALLGQSGRPRPPSTDSRLQMAVRAL